jgi:hypothetical protein
MSCIIGNHLSLKNLFYPIEGLTNFSYNLGANKIETKILSLDFKDEKKNKLLQCELTDENIAELKKYILANSLKDKVISIMKSLNELKMQEIEMKNETNPQFIELSKHFEKTCQLTINILAKELENVLKQAKELGIELE